MRSVNQNHHLYVAKSVVNSFTDETPAGAIMACHAGTGKDKDIYFRYMGYDGPIKSDLIPVNQITYIKHIPAAAQATKLKKVVVALDPNVNSGAPVSGQDYVLNISFQQFYGLSPEDNYVKTVAVHATSNMNAKAFYDKLVKELNRGFSREVGATETSNPYLEFEADKDGVTITEKEQTQRTGKWEFETLVFDVFPSTIHVSPEVDDVVWGTVTKGFSDETVPNNKKMADLEWFTFGERGDIYRGMGYPNNFDFIPMVTTNTDPDTGGVNGYDALEIHYAYQGSCEDIQKSEKDITIIGAAAQISTLKTTLQGQDYLNETIVSQAVETDQEEDGGNTSGNS